MTVTFPIIALAFWTFALGIFLLSSRISSVNNGIVTMDYYQVFRGGEPPVSVLKTTRHWANLYEAPTLFYVVCALILILQIQSIMLVQLAWAYVAIRVVHSIIHLTYNTVYHRMALFLLSQGVLIAMWIILLLKVP